MAYVSKEQIELAKQWDLLTYLQHVEPYELVKCSRNAYATRSHDSLKISNGKWFWWSRGFGGRTALDYLIKVRGISLPEAVLHLNDQHTPSSSPAAQVFREDGAKPFALPEAYENASRVVAYLHGRGISHEVLEVCLETGRLYESRNYHNAVFVGFDEHDEPRYAAIRGTTSTRYMCEVPGSDKRYAFSLPAAENSTELHLFESAIDLLSYCTFMLKWGKDWRQVHLLSLAGIYRPTENKEGSILPAALLSYLDRHADVKRLVLHLDNDEPGRLAAEMIEQQLAQSYQLENEPPVQKDVNEDLMAYKKQREYPSR
ncbi:MULTISPECIES: DUF3991 and TOPRIM domain-containing protein [Paenibacillaceae]|jgi:hypothetical protein|uniref:DUF3991 and TOPRIM domain-containing protein n=1 Tax=Paenibacillaceae TaxID=186822 RepID=UPI001ADBC0D2|nr:MULTISPECIES: DUF3991 and TOPRIM domain-containing protein [Paenibacillaceae]QTH40872.1 DUF3991 and TOPRIM domain-containing protein [Cohnella sp. LGH]